MIGNLGRLIGRNIIENQWALVPIGSSNHQIDNSLAYGCSIYSTSKVDEKQLDCNSGCTQLNGTIFCRSIRTLCVYDCLHQSLNNGEEKNSPILVGTDHGDILTITDDETNAFRLINVDQIEKKTSETEAGNVLKQKVIMLEPSFDCIVGLHVFDGGTQISLPLERKSSEYLSNSSSSERIHGIRIAILPRPSSSVFLTTIMDHFSPQSMPVQTLKLTEHENEATILSMSCSTLTMLYDAVDGSAIQYYIIQYLILTSDDKGWVKFSSVSSFTLNYDHHLDMKKNLKDYTNVHDNLDSYNSVQVRAHSGPCASAIFIGKNESTGHRGSVVGAFATGSGDQDGTIRIWNFTCTATGDTAGRLAPSISFSVSQLFILNEPNMVGTISVICPIMNGLNGVNLCVGTSSGTLLLWGVAADSDHPSDKQSDEDSWKLLSIIQHTNQPIMCAITCPPDNVLPGLLLTGDHRGTCRLYRASSAGAGSKLPLQLVAEVNLSGPCCAMVKSTDRLQSSSSTDWGYIILVASESGEIKRWHETGLPLSIPISPARKTDLSILSQHNPFMDDENTSEMYQERINPLVQAATELIPSTKDSEADPMCSSLLSSTISEVEGTPGKAGDQSHITNRSVHNNFNLSTINQDGKLIQQLPSRNNGSTKQNPKREPRKRELFVPTPALPPERPDELRIHANASAEKGTSNRQVTWPPSICSKVTKLHQSSRDASKIVTQQLLSPESAGTHVDNWTPTSQVHTIKEGIDTASNPLSRPSLNSTLAALQAELLTEKPAHRRNGAVPASSKSGASRNRSTCSASGKAFNCFSRKDSLMYPNLVSIDEFNVAAPSKTVRKQVSKEYINKMAATTPLPEDLWPNENDLIPKLDYEFPAIPLPDLSEERIYHENEIEWKMALQRICWSEPY